jgi:hypothetical protein
MPGEGPAEMPRSNWYQQSQENTRPARALTIADLEAGFRRLQGEPSPQTPPLPPGTYLTTAMSREQEALIRELRTFRLIPLLPRDPNDHRCPFARRRQEQEARATVLRQAEELGVIPPAPDPQFDWELQAPIPEPDEPDPDAVREAQETAYELRYHPIRRRPSNEP